MDNAHASRSSISPSLSSVPEVPHPHCSISSTVVAVIKPPKPIKFKNAQGAIPSSRKTRSTVGSFH